MILCDTDLAAEIAAGRLRIDPAPHPERLQPASIDLTLGLGFADLGAPRSRPVTVGNEPAGLAAPLYEHAVLLRPGAFLLATTAERIELAPDLVGQVHGKSSRARLGLMVHAAGLIDPGFRGQITLEIVNLGPVCLRLVCGIAIAQLTVTRLSDPAARPYGAPGLGSRYQGQHGATGPRTAAPIGEDDW